MDCNALTLDFMLSQLEASGFLYRFHRIPAALSRHNIVLRWEQRYKLLIFTRDSITVAHRFRNSTNTINDDLRVRK